MCQHTVQHGRVSQAIQFSGCCCCCCRVQSCRCGFFSMTSGVDSSQALQGDLHTVTHCHGDCV